MKPSSKIAFSCRKPTSSFEECEIGHPMHLAAAAGAKDAAGLDHLLDPFIGSDDGKGHHWPSFFSTTTAARSAPMHPASRASL